MLVGGYLWHLEIEKYNGCILADSVGLGKTFTALAVIKYYESRNKSVLVLCPKKLAANWNTYKENYINNPILGDRLNYGVLFHTDLSRIDGKSNGIELSRFNWSNSKFYFFFIKHFFYLLLFFSFNKYHKRLYIISEILTGLCSSL